MLVRARPSRCAQEETGKESDEGGHGSSFPCNGAALLLRVGVGQQDADEERLLYFDVEVGDGCGQSLAAPSLMVIGHMPPKLTSVQP